jgi:hypothetical protein
MVTVTPTEVQKMEFDVTTAEGPSRVTVVTGMIPVELRATSNSNDLISQSVSLTALVDPTLAPGQFRKATATAALAATQWVIAGVSLATAPNNIQFSIDDVEATFDDESGRTEVRIDVTAAAASGVAGVSRVAFQVTTLAKL